MNPIHRIGVLLVLTLSFAAVASAATVYKWKDAQGNLHFSDTPPPPDATLISGPKAATAATAGVAQPECRTDISAEECAMARAALERDAKDLASDMPEIDANATAEADRNRAEILEQECQQLRTAKAALERIQNGESHEIHSAEELATVPASIAETEARIKELCQ